MKITLDPNRRTTGSPFPFHCIPTATDSVPNCTSLRSTCLHLLFYLFFPWTCVIVYPRNAKAQLVCCSGPYTRSANPASSLRSRWKNNIRCQLAGTLAGTAHTFFWLEIGEHLHWNCCMAAGLLDYHSERLPVCWWSQWMRLLRNNKIIYRIYCRNKYSPIIDKTSFSLNESIVTVSYPKCFKFIDFD